MWQFFVSLIQDQLHDLLGPRRDKNVASLVQILRISGWLEQGLQPSAGRFHEQGPVWLCGSHRHEAGPAKRAPASGSCSKVTHSPHCEQRRPPALFQLLTQNCSKWTLSSLNFELEKVYFGISEVLYGKWGVSPRRQCRFFLTLLQTFIYSRPGKLGCSVHWAFSCTQVKSLSSFHILHFVPLWTCWKILKESWKVPLAPKNSADWEAERGNSGFIQC